ncbi:MFS quinate transporter [Aspergillus sclerotialis]|uniref:MFS quinate transporter n=1 Tax=Aspergillus sclerotialis TaxID=2070753 RepID=A0A3A2ZKX7_9EURO|nr:MFS quinate transporter [Aspergillus sclerotialis]
MGVFVWFFIPETKGMSLEKMDDLFGVTALASQKTVDTERALGETESKAKVVSEERIENV